MDLLGGSDSACLGDISDDIELLDSEGKLLHHIKLKIAQHSLSLNPSQQTTTRSSVRTLPCQRSRIE